MLQSVLLAFALYSRIPVPQAKWNEKNMRYCICFLPLVGLVIGAVQFVAFFLLAKISAGPVFSGAVLAALPVILSGGIHMDGFMDTLLDNGLIATIGKGGRSEAVCKKMQEKGAIYLCAMGGAGAIASKCITFCEVIAFPELGCESVKKMIFKDFPLIVGIDSNGNSLFVK